MDENFLLATKIIMTVISDYIDMLLDRVETPNKHYEELRDAVKNPLKIAIMAMDNMIKEGNIHQ